MDFRIDEFDVFEKGDIMETIRNVEINQLHDFKNHPFKVEVNTELCELMKSIEKEGVLVQLLVRTNPYGDGYEIISGHRRKEAAIWAGEMKIPVVIRELDDDQAVVAMVDSNLYRENLKPSEKAFAYKMKLDAMKHQGKRLSDDSLSDNGAEVLAGNEANHMTSAQVGPKCDTDGNGRTDNLENESNEVIEEHYMINSNELLARQVGESVAQIKRYIRLTNLIPKILSTEGMAVIEERIRQEAGEEARQEANKEVMSMVGSMLVAMQANKGAIAIIQQQADTDDNAESDDDFYDDVIAQSALNWMEKD
ncbi:MAG: ParB/RepB/Spo0J family partition protein [Anaerobutyricum hallii]